MPTDAKVFVGRRRELGELRAAMEQARSGQGALHLVTGEPGIGKTRLATALAAEAEAAGMLVLWGAAWEGGGAPPYWPWVQVLRELAARAGREELRDDAGHSAGFLLPIAPELRAVLGDLEPPAPLDAAQARFSAFDAVTTLIRNAAERRPILLLVEDAHAADQPSLLLLDFLSRRLRDAAVLAVCTAREIEARQDPERADLLAAIGRGARRTTLAGLEPAELAELVTAQTGRTPAPHLLDRLHELTEGNPFFADELARLLDGVEEAAALTLPDTVRETVRRRLDPLPPAVLETLSLAAVIGKEFDLDTLASAGDVADPELLSRLDTAVAAGTLAEARGPIGRFAFRHALVRETLYESLTRSDRVDAHRSVAEALERRAGAHERLSELAHHFALAATGGDAGKALDYSRRAGEHALATLAYEDAEAHFLAALAAIERGAGDDRERCGLLLALGRTRMRAGKAEAARRSLEEAVALATELGESDLVAHAALAAAGPWGLSLNVDDEALVRMLEQARAALSGAGPLCARVMAALAVAQYWSAPHERRLELVEEAIAVARAAGDPATLARVLGDAHVATWDAESLQRSLPWSDEVLAIADRLGDAELALHAHSWRTSLLLERADTVAVDEAVATFGRLADELRQPRAQSSALRHRALRALVQGRLDEVERVIAEQGAHAAEYPPGSVDFMLLAGQTFGLRWLQGRLGEIEPAVRAIVDDAPAMPVWRCALIAAHRDGGRADDLRLAYEAMAARDFATLPRDNLWLVGLAFLAEACAEVGDARGAAVLAALLEPYRERVVVAPGAAAFGPAARFLGLVELARGDAPAALRRFAAAREVAGRLLAVPWIGLIALDEARAHVLAGDPDAAAAALDEAERIAAQVGMPGQAARAAALRERVGARPAPVVSAPAPALEGGRELARRGDYWTVATGERSFLVKDLKGLHYLARLIGDPGAELHSMELVGAPAEPGTATVAPQELTVHMAGDDDAGALLDPQAKAAYRLRLQELAHELEEAERFHDEERAARLRDEIAFIGRELSSAVGLGGRDRKAASNAERARLNATRAIKAAIDRIGQQDESLADELRAAVKTGTFCAYRPLRGAPEWRVLSPGASAGR